VIRTDLTGDTPATMRMSWRIDQKAHAALEEMKPQRRSAYWYYQASDWTDDLAS